MTCPTCGSKLRTRRVDDVCHAIVRERRCTHCGYSYKTHERIVMKWKRAMEMKATNKRKVVTK